MQTARFKTGWMVAALVLGWALSAPAWDDADAKAWVDHFVYSPPPVGEMPMNGQPGRLPVVRRAEFPAEGGLVRMALPFPPGALPQGRGLQANLGDVTVPADVRVLTTHPDGTHSVRRALVTFPMERLAPDYFSSVITFSLTDTPPLPAPTRQDGVFSGELGEFRLEVDANGVRQKKNGKELWNAAAVAPPVTDARGVTTEVVESGRFFLWVRVLVPDPAWPRIIEARMDRQGKVRLTLHVQRCMPGDDYTPDLGWSLVPAEGLAAPETGVQPVPQQRLPMQSAAWRSVSTTVSESGDGHVGHAAEARFADEKAAFTVTPGVFDALYRCGVPPVLDRPFEEARQQHQNAMAAGSLANPEDAGNVTSMPAAGVFGMNRLNHCPAIFDEYYRSGRADLRRVALDWCDNFFNLTIWWGTDHKDEFGGTRYNNNVANGDKTHEGDQSFMWRSNTAVHFCTKGYDSFLYAYEETGDPRFAAALRWQTEYAARMIHTNQGECRNIGDVLDFVRLYGFTGHRPWLDEALRLFRELRDKLGPDGLFSQGGQPIEPDLTFMDDDSLGYKHPFAKPYIIGYALQGLPELARHFPEEPRLAEVIRAVAKFVAQSQDPAGGWRYPHPKSSRLLIDQAMEHAMQLSRAAAFLETQGDDIGPLLDAIERTLRARVLGLQKTGGFLNGVQGWERSTGALKDGQDIHDLYKAPTDRDAARDYTEGTVTAGSSCPEAVVYFSQVLDFYAKHREPKQLLEAGPELQLLLDRVKPVRIPALALKPELLPVVPSGEYLPYGLEKGLPTFAAARANAIAGNHFTGTGDPAAFAAWRRQGRARLMDCLLEAPKPPTDTAYATLAEEDRGAYTARKIVFSPSAEYRVPAYLLVPKGQGPFPAVLALHDHGAHFSIGKEKVVRPFGVDAVVEKDAQEWVNQCYGGRFIGDALAEKGYVVLAIDALFWGERGRREGVEYEAQQQLAANLLQLGMSWLGVIAWDDVRSAEFLACQPEVDPARIGAVGLSMGSHRTWMVNALSDRVAAGAAICWMGTSDVLMAPGNNQTKGQSAFSMIAPGLRRWLDYPAVAALAAPKPMLFFNGDQDTLFPVEGVAKAWDVMRIAWKEAGAGDRLETRMWPAPHEFNREMQDAAFDWLDRQLKPAPPQ